jgi:N-acetylglucosamine-6-sulfatase
MTPHPRRRRRTALLSAVASLLVFAASPAGGAAPLVHATVEHGTAAPPNIVLILTDDQRWDTLWAMPTVRAQLVARGTKFTKAFVVNPLCCPSRATILTGQYSHTHGVYTNAYPDGGFRKFNDSSTIATWLQADGYRTALIGKYMNEYFAAQSSYVPPGWSHWFGVFDDGGSDYGFQLSDDGAYTSYDTSQYLTDVLATEAVDFIGSTPPEQPLFLYFSPKAPHEPAIPAIRHQHLYSNLAPWRPPSFNEDDVSDKPSQIRLKPKLTADEIAALDELRLNELRSLRAVDEAVGSILDALSTSGRLANTLIVFASDNGFLLGEHRLIGKVKAYEESIRIPLVIRYDAAASGPRTSGKLVANVDFAQTFAAAAGVPAPGAEGMSLLPLLTGSPPWRGALLSEHGPGVTYCGVRTSAWHYVQYGNGEEELYSLAADRYELQNLAKDPSYAAKLTEMRSRVHQLCTPVPPTFVFSH